MSHGGPQRYTSKFMLANSKSMNYSSIQCDPLTGPSEFPQLADNQMLVAEIEPKPGSSAGQLGIGLYRCLDMDDVRRAIREVQQGYYVQLHGWGILTDTLFDDE